MPTNDLFDNDLNVILNTDPLDPNYKEQPINEVFAKFFKHNQKKQAVLQLAGDTHFNLSIKDYLNLIQTNGFILQLQEEFQGNQKDTHYIFWHPDDSILLSFCSYGDRVNGGSIYWNWKSNTDRLWPQTPCSGHIEDGVCVGDIDCREGLFYNIRKMRETGQFLQQWTKQPFLWLLNYVQKDHDACNKQILSRLSKEIQQKVCYEPQ